MEAFGGAPYEVTSRVIHVCKCARAHICQGTYVHPDTGAFGGAPHEGTRAKKAREQAAVRIKRPKEHRGTLEKTATKDPAKTQCTPRENGKRRRPTSG
eukprot:299642-Pyramimonas_sp.AAC.1